MKYTPKRLAPLHGEAIGADEVLLLHVFLLHVGVGPLDGNAVVAREGFHPLLVFAGPLGQSLLGDGIDPMHVTEEIDDVFRPRRQRQVALNDDAVETVYTKASRLPNSLQEV